jgi:hypothetical protein
MPTQASGRILVPDMSVSAANTPAASLRVRRSARTVSPRGRCGGSSWTPLPRAGSGRLTLTSALAAATGLLPATELARRQRELKLERLDVEASLARLARVVRLVPVSTR